MVTGLLPAMSRQISRPRDTAVSPLPSTILGSMSSSASMNAACGVPSATGGRPPAGEDSLSAVPMSEVSAAKAAAAVGGDVLTSLSETFLLPSPLHAAKSKAAAEVTATASGARRTSKSPMGRSVVGESGEVDQRSKWMVALRIHIHREPGRRECSGQARRVKRQISQQATRGTSWTASRPPLSLSNATRARGRADLRGRVRGNVSAGPEPPVRPRQPDAARGWGQLGRGSRAVRRCWCRW